MNSKRILASGIEVSNDTCRTNLNNNDLIIGPSGAGKTTGYVLPNLLRLDGSCVLADTKGNLKRKTEKILKRRGYKIHTVDFIDLRRSDVYNPLNYITRYRDGRWSEQDITALAAALVPIANAEDAFWTRSAQMVIVALIAYVLEALPENERNMSSALEVFKVFETAQGRRMFHALHGKDPRSLAFRRYQMIESVFAADKTWGCIHQFVCEALELFDLEEARSVFDGESSFRFSDLGEEKSVLFLNLSDVDRSYDRITGVLYTQLFQALCRHADNSPDSRLRVPVRIILDDFSTNYIIPDFDNIISVIRSREISASIILQSLTQLSAMYGSNKAKTILNNCDHILYLGGQDLETAEYIGNRTNKTPYSVLRLPLKSAIVLERGRDAQFTDKIPPMYSEQLLGHCEEAAQPDANEYSGDPR